MSARLLDGRKAADTTVERVRQAVSERLDAGLSRPGLAVILVGDDAASRVYVRNKEKACQRAGIASFVETLDVSTTEQQLLERVQQLNADPRVHGILVQLPVPDHIDQALVTNSIDPWKDVDGFHAENVGRLALRQLGLRPCTPMGIMTLLRQNGIEPKGMHAVVVGASNIVGRPMALELLLAGATVTVTHRFTRDLASHVRQAELLVVAVGKPNVVDGDWIRPGAVVVDVGIHRLEDGSLRGDLDFESAKKNAGWITPVPGGVGPMTVASLISNTLIACERFDGVD